MGFEHRAEQAETGTHSLRRTKVSLIYKATVNLRAVQILFGQAGLKTTEIYTHVGIKALKAVHTAIHPPKPIRSRLAGKHDADGPGDEAEALLALLDAEGDGPGDDAES